VTQHASKQGLSRPECGLANLLQQQLLVSLLAGCLGTHCWCNQWLSVDLLCGCTLLLDTRAIHSSHSLAVTWV
jgi:hypothetical protein